MTTRKALFAICLASAALTTTSAWADGFSFGFSYNDAPRYYRSYYAPSYVYYDTSPVYYVDPAPVVVYMPPPPPVVYYPAPTVVYRDVSPRYYRSTTVYTTGYRSCDYPRYSYRYYDRSPRIHAGGRARW
jgi:hypothetical protein